MAALRARDAHASRSELTRRRILESARELFLEKGFGATTVRQIAARSGLSDPAVYYHFATKQQIFDTLVVPPPLPLFHPAIESGEAVVFALVDHLVAWANPSEKFLLLLARVADDDGLDGMFYTGRSSAFHSAFLSMLSAWYPDDADTLADVLHAIVVGIVFDGVLAHGASFGDVLASDAGRKRLHDVFSVVLPAKAVTSPGDPEGTSNAAGC